MEREIVLSSYSAKNKDNNKPENFVTDFVRPIILDSNHEYMIGLNRIINMSFTWFNINEDTIINLLDTVKIQVVHSPILHFQQVFGIILI